MFYVGGCLEGMENGNRCLSLDLWGDVYEGGGRFVRVFCRREGVGREAFRAC